MGVTSGGGRAVRSLLLRALGASALAAALIGGQRGAGAAPPGAAPPSTRPASRPAADGPRAPRALGDPRAPMRRPMPRRVADDPSEVSDEQITRAIERAVDYLYAPMWPPDRPERYTDASGDTSHDAGVDCLAVYALLQAGMAVHDPRLDPRHDQAKWMIEGMKRYDLHGRFQVYARGIRATALALYDRPEDRDTLKADAYWLMCVCDGGAYGYTYPDPPGLVTPVLVATKSARPPLSDDVSRLLGHGPSPRPPGSSGSPGEQEEQVPPATRPGYPGPGETTGESTGDKPAEDSKQGTQVPQDPGARLVRAKEYLVDAKGYWDNSNTQYGVLGVWSAAEAGVEVPRAYWLAVERHWSDYQGVDGHWEYASQPRHSLASCWLPPSTIALANINMTCAGLASTLVTGEYLDQPENAQRVGRLPFGIETENGLRWLERDDNSMPGEAPSFWIGGYGFYGLERVGLASGFKHFGTHDWYKEGARVLVAQQAADGHWPRGERNDAEPVSRAEAPETEFAALETRIVAGDLVKEDLRPGVQISPRHPDRRQLGLRGGKSVAAQRADLIDTAFCLLFLARGRHPIVMAKLRFDGVLPVQAVAGLDVPGGVKVAVNAKPSDMWTGYWANRPRDAANLARFASKRLERQFNWETLNIDRDWEQWTDAPVLELASHTAPQFTDAQVEKLRDYVLAGGLLFTHADGSSPQFNAYAAKLARQLFPQYEWADVPPGHPLYTNDAVFNVSPRPPLKMLSNGSRVLVLHSPTDITRWWQTRDEVRHRAEFELGVNTFVYAAGKQDFRNRLQQTWVPQPAAKPLDTLKLARVSYGGNWSPEPFAWRRYGNWLQKQTGTWIETYAVPVGELRTLAPDQLPVAHLTGTAAYNFTAADAAQVRAYVQAGGVLLVDVCGGTGPFDRSAEALLAAAFPGQTLQPLPMHHPLLKKGNPGTEDVTHPLVRAEAAKRYGRGVGSLRYLASGKGHVLYTPLDVTSGLLGVRTLGILGYEPAYAEALMKNILFWALDGQQDR